MRFEISKIRACDCFNKVDPKDSWLLPFTTAPQPHPSNEIGLDLAPKVGCEI